MIDYEKVKQHLACFGITYDGFLEQMPFTGKFIIPSILSSINKEFAANIDDTKREHAFLTVASSCFKACNQVAYMRPEMYKQANYEQFKLLVGDNNAELFKKAVYAEVETRCASNKFPQLADAASSSFSSVNYNPMQLSLLLTIDQICLGARTYLDSSTWNQIKDLKLDPSDEKYAFRTLSNVYSGIEGEQYIGFFGWDEKGNIKYYQGYISKIDAIELQANNNKIKISDLETHVDSEVANINEQLNNKVNNETLEDYATIVYVDSKVFGVFRFKGRVDTFDNLPIDAEMGDIYFVIDEGSNYAYTDANEWVRIGNGYILLPATTDRLGGIMASTEDYKVNVDANGIASVNKLVEKLNSLDGEISTLKNRVSILEEPFRLIYYDNTGIGNGTRDILDMRTVLGRDPQEIMIMSRSNVSSRCPVYTHIQCYIKNVNGDKIQFFNPMSGIWNTAEITNGTLLIYDDGTANSYRANIYWESWTSFTIAQGDGGKVYAIYAR